MQDNIPILVTKKKHKHSDLIFKVATPELIDKLNLIRNPTLPKQRNSNLPPRHQTLDSDSIGTRTRRISSSAASKRFPKDFFKEENNPSNPMKSNRTQRKQYEFDFVDTFSKKTIINMQLEDPQKKEDEDTPKFKCKKTHEPSTKDKLLQYIKNKQLQVTTPTIHDKYNTCPQADPKLPLGIFNKQQNVISNKQQNQPVMMPNFNITLGQKQSLLNMMQKQKKARKKQEVLEKENNNYLIPFGEVPKRENLARAEGFRIRRKVLS